MTVSCSWAGPVARDAAHQPDRAHNPRDGGRVVRGSVAELLDTGGFTGPITEVIQLGAANVTSPHDLDP